MNAYLNDLFREANRARGSGKGQNRSPRRGKTPVWKRGMEHFCKRCGGELIDTGEDEKLVCRECGLVSNQLVFSNFNSSNLPPNGNRPLSRENRAPGGKGGVKTFGKVDPIVKRQQDIQGLVAKVYQQAGSLQNPPKDVIDLVSKISEARDYTPRVDPDKYPIGTIVEGREGVEYVVEKGKGVEGGNVWKLADPKQKVPHRLRGIVILELVGIIRYINGVSMEAVHEFWNAASKKPPKNGFVVLRKLMKDDGVSQILYPIYRRCRDKANEAMTTYYPENKLFSKEETQWIRQRINRVIDTMTVPVELAVRGTLVLFDLVKTMKCIRLMDCLKRFRLTKHQWEKYVETAKTIQIFKRDLKLIEP